MRSLSYEERLARSGLWTPEHLEISTLVEIYIIIHGVLPVTFETFQKFSYNSDTRGYLLRLQRRTDCQACGLNRGDAMYYIRWMKQIRGD